MDIRSPTPAATPRQIAYARMLARRNQALLPWVAQQDRRSLSACIETQAKLKPLSALVGQPSSRQVAFAERLARIKHRAGPGRAEPGRAGPGRAGGMLPGPGPDVKVDRQQQVTDCAQPPGAGQGRRRRVDR